MRFPKFSQSSEADVARHPDFFIAGAARSGTTSLWRYLLQHPSIYMPDASGEKEPGYFSSLRPFQDRRRYLSLFEGASDNQVVGEASGAYLTSPDSAGRIASAIPDARIIIMLRNPADRAYSLYKWMTHEGYEYTPTFRRALALESQRMDDENFARDCPEYYYNYLYYHSGLYSEQIARYVNLFPRHRLKFIVFERFIEAPMSYTQEVYRFLGVDPTFTPTISVQNRSRDVWSPRWQYFICHRLSSFLYTLCVPRVSQIKSALMTLNLRPQKTPLDPSLRKHLLDRYEDDIHRTASQTSLPLAKIWL
jgi:hypothetical protein